MESKIDVDNSESRKKQEIIEKGLPVDWLVRAHACHSMETLLYLCEQRQKWINEDQKIVLSILQDYKSTGSGLIASNTPLPYPRKPAHGSDAPEIYIFTCQLLDLVREEPPIWDKANCEEFGYHQPMRQSWCSISLKLGGWGTIEHVHMLKSIYRRRRDQYNIEHLRRGKPFLYSEKLEFLKNLLEKSKSDKSMKSISLQEHIDALEPKIDYETEFEAAPKSVQDILNEISSRIDKVSAHNSPEVLAQYLTKCCNEVIAHREHLAIGNLDDDRAHLHYTNFE